MDSSTALALAANLVAMCAIVVAWRQNHDNLANQSRLADLGHVRGLLDEAAIALHGTAYVLDEIRSQVTQHTPSFFKSEKGTEVFANLEGCGRDLDALVERLRLRFGREHKVVASFRAADVALLDIYQAAGLVRLEPEPDGSSGAAHAVRQFDDQTRERLRDQRTSFDEARDDFIDAAHAVAGAQLTGS